MTRTATQKMYFVWSPNEDECVGFDDYRDAYWTAHGHWPEEGRNFGSPALGEAFRELYEEALEEGTGLEITQTEVALPGSDSVDADVVPTHMHRFRFLVPGDDPRPMAHPPTGPYWISGENGTHFILVAFAPDLETLTNADHWPDAEEIQDFGYQEIEFFDRFPKPGWWPSAPETA